MENFKKHLSKYLFAYLILLMGIFGNIICWYTNDKLMKPLTQIAFVFLIFVNITNANRKENIEKMKNKNK